MTAIPLGAIDAALDLLPRRMSSRMARVMMVAIGYQESGFEHRYQIVAGKPGVKGPARGYWQFERDGGVAGVLNHSTTYRWSRAICHERDVLPKRQTVWARLEHDDVLAAAFARMLLWTDPRPLPTYETEAWENYLRNWRPGKPHPQRWPAAWEQATRIVWGWD